MPEEIDLNDEEEAALDAAWKKMARLPPPSRLLGDDDSNVPAREKPDEV